MGVFWTRTRSSFICTPDSSCHVSQLPLAPNVSSYSMPSFREKPCATNISLYPTMFPSTTWWNYEILFRSRYSALTSFFLNWSSLSSWWMEGSALMMSLHSSCYSSFWNVVTCSSEQVSSFFGCSRLCMRSFLQVKCIYMVRNIS